MNRLAAAMKNLYEFSGPIPGEVHHGSSGLEAGAMGLGSGAGSFIASRDQKRQEQLLKAKQTLEAKKASEKEERDLVQEIKGQDPNGPSPKDVKFIREASGSQFEQVPQGSTNPADAYGSEWTKAMGQHLQSQESRHEAALSAPVNGEMTQQGKDELHKYATVNGQDQGTARGMVRVGMGMSQPGINPTEDNGNF